MRNTTDMESLKCALDAQKALLNTISSYEKHQLNREKLDNSKNPGHGITILETEER